MPRKPVKITYGSLEPESEDSPRKPDSSRAQEVARERDEAIARELELDKRVKIDFGAGSAPPGDGEPDRPAEDPAAGKGSLGVGRDEATAAEPERRRSDSGGGGESKTNELGSYLDNLVNIIPTRFEASRLQFCPLDAATQLLWADALKAYLVGLDLAALRLGVATCAELLRAALRRVCADEENPESEIEDRIRTLSLPQLALRANQQQLIGAEDVRFFESRLQPLGDPTAYENPMGLLQDVLGDGYEPVDHRLDKWMAHLTKQTAKVARTKWLDGSGLDAIAKTSARQTLELASAMSKHLDGVVGAIPRSQLPMDWA